MYNKKIMKHCVLTVLAFLVLYVVMQALLTHRRRFRYSPTEFKSVTRENRQFLMFPLRDTNSDKVVGTAYTRSAMYPRQDGSSDVLQDITFKLDDGMTTTRIFFNNPSTAGSVISKSSVFKASLSNGTGKYINNRGTVQLTVNADGSRDVAIKCLPW